jgi:mono/diheme cytochrome c family protein
MKIRYPSFFSFIVLVQLAFSTISSQQKGEADFKQICSVCHSIGKGRLIGPDLAKVDQRHTEEWIIKFVHSSQTVIKKGDAYADSLFKAYNQVLMPDQASLTDNQIRDIIAYIKIGGPGTTGPVTANLKTDSAIVGDSQKGKDLFIGNIRFANGGPTCNSCHNVNHQGMITGGALAKDLTKAVSRLTVDGVKGVISGLPFPQMKQSYAKGPLTPQEIDDIAAFLKDVDTSAASQLSSNVGNSMIIGGALGIIILLILFSIFWINRKQRTVNYDIYERQIKSFH